MNTKNDLTKYRVHIIKNLNDLTHISDDWKKLQWHPNTDFDFYNLIVSIRDNIIGPYVLVLEKENEVKSILVGRLEIMTFKYKIGYKEIFKLCVKSINILYGGILGDIDENVSNKYIKSLKRALTHREANLIKFSSLNIDSLFYKILRDSESTFYKLLFLERSTHYLINITNSFEEFMSRFKSKHLYNFRRSRKKIEKDFNAKMLVKVFTHDDDIEKMCKDVEFVSKKTYHRKLGFGFQYNKHKYEYNKRFKLLANNDSLCGIVAYINETPISFWIFTIYKGISYADWTGYDPRLKKYSIGILTLIDAIKYFCSINVEKIDFGVGEAFYKERFGGEEFDEEGAFLFPKTIKGFFMHISYNLLDWLNIKIKGLLKLIGFLGRIKRHERYKKVK